MNKPHTEKLTGLMRELAIDWPKDVSMNVSNASPDLRQRIARAIYPEDAEKLPEAIRSDAERWRMYMRILKDNLSGPSITQLRANVDEHRAGSLDGAK